METKNKFKLEAVLVPCEGNIEKKAKELATVLQLPEAKQKDLLYMSAILVSTGTNSNGAHFLGSELIKARDSINAKPLDIEHEENKIIGHITSAMYLDFDGNIVDDKALFASLSEQIKAGKEKAAVDELDKLNLDIGIVCVVYKDRFRTLAKEIEGGDWKVSMECYYDDFDLLINDQIIKREDFAGISSQLDGETAEAAKEVVEGKVLSRAGVARVLRNIRFCGVGIVKNPANERSLVLEAATRNALEALAMEQIYQEAASAASQEKPTMVDEVVEVQAHGYFILRNGTQIVPDTFNLNYNEAAKDAIRRTKLDTEGASYSVVTAPSKFIPRTKIEINESSNAVTYKVNEVGDIKEIHSFGEDPKAVANVSPRFGPVDNSAGICASFRKYLYERPGNPDPGRIIASHWCKLFNKACPVFGADAQDKSCLRNRYSHLIRVDDTTNPGLDMFSPLGDPAAAEQIDNTALPIAEDPLQPVGTDPTAVPAPTEVTPAQTAPTFLEVPSGMGNVDKEALALASALSGYVNPSFDELKGLESSKFGLEKARKYPLHSEAAIKYTMAIFPKLSLSLGEKRELYKKILLKSSETELDFVDFADKFFHLAGEELSGDYALPRLKLLPLDSREQVIAAMARCKHVKAPMTDLEKQGMIVNILRAAKRFEVDCKAFRKRFLSQD